MDKIHGVVFLPSKFLQINGFTFQLSKNKNKKQKKIIVFVILIFVETFISIKHLRRVVVVLFFFCWKIFCTQCDQRNVFISCVRFWYRLNCVGTKRIDWINDVSLQITELKNCHTISKAYNNKITRWRERRKKKEVMCVIRITKCHIYWLIWIVKVACILALYHCCSLHLQWSELYKIAMR